MVLLASDFDQSRFLTADDLSGGERKFKIKDVTVEEVGGKEKLVAWFTNHKKGFVVNKLNNRVLRAAFGDDTARWKDRIIVLFSTLVQFGGRMVPGLRVRIPPPKQASTTPVSSPTYMSRGQETQLLGSNGPVAAKSANNKKKPPVRDELDEVLESQPPPEDPDDELNDDVDF